MFVQWCVKGIAGRGPHDSVDSGLDDRAALDIVTSGKGIQCNWWRNQGKISPEEVRARLTSGNLDRHRHDYQRYGHETPFISLTAGCVSRDAALRLNRIHEAEDIALRFATDWGRQFGYLYVCWVIVGMNPAVTVQSVAEEVRELNTYLSWSDYQLEGEITAKIEIPANQIAWCERWDPDGTGKVTRTWRQDNSTFDGPEAVSNLRELL